MREVAVNIADVFKPILFKGKENTTYQPRKNVQLINVSKQKVLFAVEVLDCCCVTIKKWCDRPHFITIKLVMWPHYDIVCLVLCLQLICPGFATYTADDGPPPVSILTYTGSTVHIVEAFHYQPLCTVSLCFIGQFIVYKYIILIETT